ncbi:ATP phosphoribosyltransferase regulatory subunit [Mesobaculum littorinae]|uniref:Histidine--tRNA ligase n=1 Tax=Mesobaculum littorinae TaxID=2486419 RepID=A0A438ADR4_9RHOB|nr:ATP phosphoribosyltransferase regulatory subunit [Mesobaculum littorinae]RVV96807.1 ATP phosphoribosyltransferase regulatory subunit [Mesobaculum littorinae]
MSVAQSTPPAPADRSGAEAARFMAAFAEAGARPIEAAILQEADLLLDLYGEDIRARAFTTWDPTAGEMMLRPDFTVPVVRMHMDGGADPARYCYSGPVFRRQETDPGRAREYLQCGFELFDASDPARADAEVFALFAEVLRPYGLRAATGDIGILTAAVRGLDISDRRRAALLRHVWRPRRFRALLDRFSGKTPVPQTRAALLGAADPLADAGPEIGLRSRGDVMARIEALRADAEEPPISSAQVALIDDILELKETAPNVLAHLGDIAVDLPAIGDATAMLRARLDALDAAGVDVDALEFEASYGRTLMEYYDGFVFGFYAPHAPGQPPVATGGRYDALTRVLGRGKSIPAVGGVIRPALLPDPAETAT